MKVVFLLSNVPDPRMYRRIMALKEEHRIVLIYWDRCITGVKYSVPDGIECYRVCMSAPLGQWFRRLLPFGRFWVRALRILRTKGADVLHCDNLDMLLVGWSYRMFFCRNTKLVYEVADLAQVIFNEAKNPARRVLRAVLICLERLCCKDVSFLVVTSPYFWNVHFCRFISRDKVLFMPNAPEYRIFGHYRKVPHKGFTIGVIGSVRYPRQIKMLIDVVQCMDRVSVLIAGAGKHYDEIRQYCAGRVRVEFRGPFDYQREILDLYSRIDCVYAVYDPRIENVRVALPNRLYEAIACELPIVAAEETALGHFVRENQIGFAIPAYGPEALRLVIEQMVMDPNILVKIGERLRAMKVFAEEGYVELRKRYRDLSLGGTPDEANSAIHFWR